VISGCRLKIADWRTRTAITLLACCALAVAYSGGPPDGKTGRPGEGTCNDCHSGVGSADSTELVGFVGGWYQPDSLYSLTLSVRYVGQLRWGFELTVVDDSNHSTGQLIVADSTNTQYSPVAPGYLKQTSAGTFPGTPGPTAWTFSWQAPAAGTGPVRFYWCANAADNNGASSGDIVCRDSLVLSEAAGIGSEPVRGRFAWRYSNPARNRAVISYQGDANLPVRIYSATGRLVRAIRPAPDGAHLRVVWDGRDDAGRIVPEARYFIRLGAEVTSVVQVQLIR